jgi:type IV secretory pathway component VirB8
MAGLRAKQAVESLADREVDQAIQKLKDAALEEYRLLEDLDKNRKWFWAAAIAFVLCLAVEFFTVVFLV